MSAPEREAVSELDREIESGRSSMFGAAYVSLLLFLSSVAETFHFLLPCVALFVLVAFALTHQGNRGARAILVLGFASGAISAAFFAYGAYARRGSAGVFLPAFALGSALCAGLLARPNVGAFLRHQRLLLLLPQSSSEEAGDSEDDD